jgi:hypothetical protein
MLAEPAEPRSENERDRTLSGPALIVSRFDDYFLTFASFTRAAEP